MNWKILIVIGKLLLWILATGLTLYLGREYSVDSRQPDIGWRMVGLVENETEHSLYCEIDVQEQDPWWQRSSKLKTVVVNDSIKYDDIGSVNWSTIIRFPTSTGKNGRLCITIIATDYAGNREIMQKNVDVPFSLSGPRRSTKNH